VVATLVMLDAARVITDNFRTSSREVSLEAREAEEVRESVRRLQLEIEQLRASRERLVRAADAERRRIERDLHDGPQQHLVSLAVNLQHVRQLMGRDPVAAQTVLEEMRQDVQAALDETRKLALRIYPPLVEPNGLRLALRTAVATAGFSTGIEVADDVSGPPEIAAAVYFCCMSVLEQLGTEASSAITVGEEADEITFEIVQVGSGRVAVSLDFALAQEWLESLGGRLVLASDPRRGIRVRGSLPTSS
jgi:signal transduction histidine kinase